MTPRIVLAVLISLAIGRQAEAETTGCKLTPSGDGTLIISLTARPQARLVVDLTADTGRSLTVTFDSSSDSALVREVRLIGGSTWTATVAGERSAVPTPDGKGSVFISYLGDGVCGAGPTLKASLKVLTVALNGAHWVDVNDNTGTPPTKSEVTVALQLKGSASVAGVASATNLAIGVTSGAARGLESTVPDAIRETLSLLAEIAVDRAKAEGARLLKDRIKKYVCDNLTIESVFGTSADGTQRLLPSTCGQLENLRITDLGASATGFVDALRQDLVNVVLPAVVANIGGTGAFAKAAALATRAKQFVPIITMMIRRGVQPDSVRLALLTLLDETSLDANLKLAIETALQCTKQDCTLGDLETLLGTISDTLPGPKQFWSDITLRLLAILRIKANEDATKLGAQLIEVLLDVAKRECASDAKCEVVVGALRDVSLGIIEADYLRALGGLQAILASTHLAAHLEGKPLELVASITSYISTYRDTKDEDAKVARELRKKALEGLIDAATDRTNRNGQWIASIGASVGFTGGRQYVRSDFGPIDAEQRLQDLRLPLGVTVQRMPGVDSKVGFGWYAAVAIADIAQFATSPKLDESGMAVEAETQWSDFVVAELQAGVRFGSDRIPLLIGLDAYYTPRQKFDVAGESKSTSVFHVGVFAGFNVPFFDLN